MNFWKTTLISAFAFMGIGTTVLVSSCEEDPCIDLACKNGGSCSDGFCRCPTGYEGTQCEFRVADKFVGYYEGNTKCGTTPPFYDSVHIKAVNANTISVVKFTKPLDTVFATVNADGVSATYTGEPNQRTARISLDWTKNLTFNIEETINGTRQICTFNGKK